MQETINIRLALEADIDALHTLIAESVRGLMPKDYDGEVLESALGNLLGLDTQLIADRTYFVAEDANGGFAACGGWSRRFTLFGSDHRAEREDRLLDPVSEPARIRAFFVHPQRARQGLGSRLLKRCEEAAQAEGFRALEMGATLTGVPLYRAHSYVELETIKVPMPRGMILQVVRMGKSLAVPATE